MVLNSSAILGIKNKNWISRRHAARGLLVVVPSLCTLRRSAASSEFFEALACWLPTIDRGDVKACVDESLGHLLQNRNGSQAIRVPGRIEHDEGVLVEVGLFEGGVDIACEVVVNVRVVSSK